MVLRTETLKGTDKRNDRSTFAWQHSAFFDFDPMCQVLGCGDGRCRPQRARPDPWGFNHFNPDFVYRYRRLPDVTVERFVDLAVCYSHRSATWPEQ